MADYKILLEEATGEIIEKKSRFIAYIKPVSNEDEASQFIESIRKKHYDARHNCSAFVIGDNNEISRCSDDGEPSGTAGRPMLEVLTKEGYHNVCAVVTRYFGGVLLGTGGLIRAYQGSLKEGLDNAKKAKVIEGIRQHITVSYNDIGKILNSSKEDGYILENVEYGENIAFDLITEKEAYDKAFKDITNITNGQAKADEPVLDKIIINI